MANEDDQAAGERVSEEVPAYAHIERAGDSLVELDEVQWVFEDKDADDKALLKLIDFLEARGLRTHPSCCESAMQAIDALSREVESLRAKLAERTR